MRHAVMKERNVKFGVFLPTFAGGDKSHHDCPYYNKIDWLLTCDFAMNVEELGFDSIWICDHLMLGKDRAIFEGWTSLTYLTAITRRVSVGTFLVCNSYRNPALLAKMA